MEGADPVRRDKLIELLDIDLQWRMHKVSDGQRRRVQICMGLLHPFKVSRFHDHGVLCYYNWRWLLTFTFRHIQQDHNGNPTLFVLLGDFKITKETVLGPGSV